MAQPDARQAAALERICDILALIADKLGVNVPDALFPAPETFEESGIADPRADVPEDPAPAG